MSENTGELYTENNYDVITSNTQTNQSDNSSMNKPIEKGASNSCSSSGCVTNHTYEGLNRNKSVNRTYDTLEHDQDLNQKIYKNPKKMYFVVGIISLLIGAVLTGSVVFVIIKKGNSSESGHQQQLIQGNNETLGFRLDRSTLHTSKYISEDDMVLGNKKSDRTPISGNQIQDYKGASANIYVKNNDVIYYEVVYEYSIRKVLVSTNLLLEIGLAERGVLHNHEFVGNVANGWSFALARCGSSKNICFRAKHNRDLKVNTFFSLNRPGETVMGIFEVFINMKKHTFSLAQNRTMIYTFEGIPSGLKLFPVFGVYHKSKADVQLNIINAMNLANFPNKSIF